MSDCKCGDESICLVNGSPACKRCGQARVIELAGIQAVGHAESTRFINDFLDVLRVIDNRLATDSLLTEIHTKED